MCSPFGFVSDRCSEWSDEAPVVAPATGPGCTARRAARAGKLSPQRCLRVLDRRKVRRIGLSRRPSKHVIVGLKGSYVFRPKFPYDQDERLFASGRAGRLERPVEVPRAVETDHFAERCSARVTGNPVRTLAFDLTSNAGGPCQRWQRPPCGADATRDRVDLLDRGESVHVHPCAGGRGVLGPEHRHLDGVRARRQTAT